MKVTRVLQADTPTALHPICKAAGFLRADVWRRYGGLQGTGKTTIDIRNEITAAKLYHGLPLDGTIRNETVKDVVNDILAYRAAAKKKVRGAIFVRTEDTQERKRLFTALKVGTWQQDNFLHRQMRKHFRHGASSVDNQFIVRSDRCTTDVQDGCLVITIKIAPKQGSNIVLTTTSSGKGVDLAKRNLRIIVQHDRTEIHYAVDKQPGRPCGKQTIGVDKGYTEAFVDSDGHHHGPEFGPLMTNFSNQAHATGKARNRLWQLEKRHRAEGHVDKADNIRDNNLGNQKVNRRKQLAQTRLRGVVFKAVHQVVDKAAVVVSEDLTSPIPSKRPWKQHNRKMSGWAKGVLAEALDSICKQRGASHELVNCAYTSQMDSCTGLLQGRRSGDKFYRPGGDVLQADHNAAMNVLARLTDPEIKLFTPYREVRRILLARSSGGTDRQGHELPLACC